MSSRYSSDESLGRDHNEKNDGSAQDSSKYTNEGSNTSSVNKSRTSSQDQSREGKHENRSDGSSKSSSNTGGGSGSGSQTSGSKGSGNSQNSDEGGGLGSKDRNTSGSSSTSSWSHKSDSSRGKGSAFLDDPAGGAGGNSGENGSDKVETSNEQEPVKELPVQGANQNGNIAGDKGGRQGQKEEAAPTKPGGSKKAMAGAAAMAAPAVINTALLAALLLMLKKFGAAALSAAMGFFGKIGAFLAKIGSAIAGAYMSVVGTVASAITTITGGVVSGMTAATASAASITVILASTVALGVGGVAERISNPVRHDGLLESCQSVVENAANANTVALEGDASAQTMANAKLIYSVLSGMGMSDTNIAGILGNWSDESGIDSTAVETIFDERFSIGPRKKAAQDADFSIRAINASYAAEYPTIKQAGIGLGQWTNGRNVALVSYSKEIGQPWHDIMVQLGFMVSKDSKAAWVRDFVQNEASSVDEATERFMREWEGLSKASSARRKAAASDWYKQMQSGAAAGWAADEARANSILSQAGAGLGSAGMKSVSDKTKNCNSAAGVYDNSSLAAAVTSYAWPSPGLSRGNNGTKLYQELHQMLYPGYNLYQSCDVSMSVGIRWTGTDKDYPKSGVYVQLQHMIANDQYWQEVNWNKDPANLLPGDIIIRNDHGGTAASGLPSHTAMWVGPELVQSIHGTNAKPGGNIVHGSLGTRSPGVDTFYEFLKTFRVFRNVQQNPNPQWVNYKPRSGVSNVSSAGVSDGRREAFEDGGS